MTNHLEGSLNQPERGRRVGRVASWLLAGATGIASIYGGFPSLVNARTLDNPKPLNFTETDCSAQTIIPGKREHFASGNGVIFARGYDINEETRSGEIRFAMVNARQGGALSISTWNLDMTMIVRPAEEIAKEIATKSAAPAIGIKIGFVADTELNPLDITANDDKGTQVFETIFPNASQDCSTGVLNLYGGFPNMEINGEKVVMSDALFKSLSR